MPEEAVCPPGTSSAIRWTTRVYRLEDIQQAHRDMEDGTVGSKAVVVL